MSSITVFMTQDHRACDARLAEVERSVQAGQWPAAATAWQGFTSAMRCHLAREEELLFPAFERATGQRGGPTTMMRMEHDQMRALLDQLEAAVRAQDARKVLGLSESLMVLIQQHNMKEEQILYPMCEQAIPDAGALAGRIAAFAREPA